MIPRSIFNAVFTGWIQDDQNALDSTEAAASLCESSGELSRNKGNCSSKHRTTYNAGVISGASKWVEDEEGGGGGGGKSQQGWDSAASNHGNR